MPTIKSKYLLSPRTFYYICFAVFTLITYFLSTIHDLSFLTFIITTGIFFAIGEFSEYSPLFLSKVFTNRKIVAYSVIAFCSIIAAYLFYKYSPNALIQSMSLFELIIVITQFAIQGAIVGVLIRMLFLNLFAQVIRFGDIHKAKILILSAWMVFFIMFPFGLSHKSLSWAYVWGFGIGFYIHYSVRRRDKRRAYMRNLKERILKESNAATLSPPEKKAIELYVNRKWGELNLLLVKIPKESDLITFIKSAMFRNLKEYEKAINIIESKLKKNPQKQLHFYYLHRALNEIDIYRDDPDDEKMVFEYLEKAYEGNNNCMLTCAIFSLKLSSKTDGLSTRDIDRAHDLIWNAITIFEEQKSHNIISLITGMTVPVTYTFLLDTYAYSLFKLGRIKLAKELFYQCIFKDPNYSNTYLHLAELYFAQSQIDDEFRSKYRNWRNTIMLFLHVAIEIEKQNGFRVEGTFITNRAEKMLIQVEKAK